MQQQLLDLFQQYPNAAIIISLLINILIALSGILPSFFITAANLYFFGFWPGTALSVAGEAAGAAVAFILYRKGLRNWSKAPLERYPRAKKLVEAKGKEAFQLVLALRLIPFVPSGLVTVAAAIGQVAFGTFFIASTLGKIPALLIEAAAVHQVTQFGWAGKIILAGIAVYILYQVLKPKQP